MLIEREEVAKKDKLMKKKIKRRILFALLLALIVACFAGSYFASRILQTKGYSGLWDFTKTVSSNYRNGMGANPEKISIEIKNKDYKFLEKNRERALERNVIINNIDGDYVPATFEYQGKKLKVKLRLKGHMTDHLQDNKWSFRVKVKDKDSFMGMKRFSIQHPGTRGYVYEWIYHELMKREDIIALRYKFINVTVNGRDWGIYAVEENFDKELIENNKRKNAPVIRFNPDLYWVNRYNLMKGMPSADEFSSYYSAYIEPYSEDAVLSDSTQRIYFLKAMALVEGLRSKKLSVDQVFDIERMAKFHAIIDLVGGEHSIDWSDIKYYYNPIKGKLEPVAYESFTNFPLRDITGSYKYIQLDSVNENYDDWHTAIFSNSAFFKAYINNLERLSKPSYLDNFFSSSNSQLNNNLRILNKEFPYKKFDKQGYYRNQLMIKKILATPKAIHAYFNGESNNQIHLLIGAIESLPVEIKYLSIGNIIAQSSTSLILAAKQRNQYVNYKKYDFTLPPNFVWNDSLIKSMKINYSILGASQMQEAVVFNYPHTESEFISDDLKNKKSTIHNFPFLTIDQNNKTIFIKPGKQVITSDIIIPSGYKVFANTGVSLDIKNGAKIISYSAFVFSGTEEQQIIIQSSDSTSQGIEFINASKSKFNQVIFKNLPKVTDLQWGRSGAITFYESPVEFTYCSFYNFKSENAVNVIRSGFSFTSCVFHQMHDDALDVDFSEGSVTNSVFENCNGSAFDITSSNLKLKSIYINGSDNKALNIKAGAQLTGDDIRIKNTNIAIFAEELSNIDLLNVTITDSQYGIVAYKEKPDGGHPSINVKKLSMENVKNKYFIGKNSSINIDGKEIQGYEREIETIRKGDKRKNK